MSIKESLKILDKCIAWLESLSDEDIRELAEMADEYMLKSENDGEFDYTAFEIIVPKGEGG